MAKAVNFDDIAEAPKVSAAVAKGNLSKILNVRFTEIEHATLKKNAEAQRLSMANYIRLLIERDGGFTLKNI